MNPLLWSFQTPLRVNLFFALRPPPQLRPRIERLGRGLKRAHGLDGHSIGQNRLHATLASVHDPRYPLREVVSRAASVAAQLRYQRFSVRFESTQSFDVHRRHFPLVLRGGSDGLTGFHRALSAQMRGAGFDVPVSFTPHITLLWADRWVEEYPIAPIHWTVEDFVLVMSMVGQSRHILLGRWGMA